MNKLLLPAFAVIAVLIVSPSSAFGGTSIVSDLGPSGESALIPIELVSMDLVGGDPVTVQLKQFPLPLATDPTNSLPGLPASIDGYGFVLSDITITLSSQPSTGYVQLIKTNPPGVPGPNTIQNGDEFQVDSFFDVFYDIEVTDVDTRPGRDYFGAAPPPVLTWPDVPTEDTVASLPSTTCTADTSLPLLGCMDELLYVGDTPYVIPLNFDVNDNGEDDVLKFKIHELFLGGDSYDLSSGDIEVTYPDSFFDIEIEISDESSDPPFDIQLIPEPPDPPGIELILRPVPGALPELPGFPDEEDDDDGDGLRNDDDPNPNDPCDPNPFGPACTGQVIGGEIIPIESTTLLLAGLQTSAIWLAPVVVSAVGIGLVLVRRI